MLNKTKKVILVICLGLISYSSFGQNTTNSPFSMFGIGDLFNSANGKSASMGGVATPLYTLFNLNPSNPATYSSVPQNTFVFEVGLAANRYTFKTDSQSFSKNDANILSLTIGFPITKRWKAGFGLNPISSVGYNIQETQYLPFANDTSRIVKTYMGEGGINSFYFLNSFQIFKSFSVGFKVAYLFGSLNRDRWLDSYSRLSNTYYKESNKYLLDAFSFTFGAHFHKNISEKIILNLGTSYILGQDMNTRSEQFATYEVVKGVGVGAFDTISNPVLQQGKIQLPQSIAVGASVILSQKLELAFDYQVDKWSDCKFFGESQGLFNNQRYSFGFEYIPDNNSSEYYKIIRYRGGFNYTNSYLSYQNKQLKQIGGSIGLGLPLRSGIFISTSLIYNHRSIPGNKILTENNYQLNLNLSFKANWFNKIHYN